MRQPIPYAPKAGNASPCRADLLDHVSLVHAVAMVLAAWHRIDVLVNNGRYVGPGHMDHVLDTPIPVLRDHLEANALAPVVLIKEVVPGMIERGGGTVIDITSSAAYEDPPAPAGAGGWGLGYAFSKGALHRIVGVLAVEEGRHGIRAFNIQPGFIATERIRQDMGRSASTRPPAPPPRSSARCAAGCSSRPRPMHSAAGPSRRSRCAASAACCRDGRSRRDDDTREAARCGRASLRRAWHRRRVDGRDRTDGRPTQRVRAALPLRQPRRCARRAARTAHPRHPGPARRTARSSQAARATMTRGRRPKRSCDRSPSSRNGDGASARTCNTEASCASNSIASPLEIANAAARDLRVRGVGSSASPVSRRTREDLERTARASARPSSGAPRPTEHARARPGRGAPGVVRRPLRRQPRRHADRRDDRAGDPSLAARADPTRADLDAAKLRRMGPGHRHGRARRLVPSAVELGSVGRRRRAAAR